MSGSQPPVPPPWTPPGQEAHPVAAPAPTYQPDVPPVPVPPVPVPPYAQPAQPVPTPPYAHPGASAPQPGYAAPYTAPVYPQYGAALAAPPAKRSPMLGIVTLIAAGIAALTPIAAAIAGFQIGLLAGRDIAMMPTDAEFDLSVLAPARDWVLLGEVAFWIGTILGLWAFIQGIVAIAQRRGRGAGIVSVVIAVLASIVFWIALTVALGAGSAAGSSIGG